MNADDLSTLQFSLGSYGRNEFIYDNHDVEKLLQGPYLVSVTPTASQKELSTASGNCSRTKNERTWFIYE